CSYSGRLQGSVDKSAIPALPTSTGSMGFRPPPCTTSATSTASQPLVTVATHASSPAAPMATLLTTPSTELHSGQDPHSAITLPPFQSLVQQVEALAQSVG
ncbi:hypothetical protein IWQ62_006790, partial [Dispira parvispora]